MSIEVTDEMYKRALVSRGDTDRIVKMIKKAESGQDIKVVFFGGLITQGCNAALYEECYVQRTYRYLKNKFNNITVNYINAGVGATGSLIGVHRAGRMAIAENPDLVFVDCAVNDEDDVPSKEGYESLIRNLLTCSSKPAVVEIFMTKLEGDNVQDQEIKIGKQYNVPMISYRNAVYDEIQKKKITWNDIITDEVHPNSDGHEIISVLLSRFIEDVYNNEYKNNKEIALRDNVDGKECVYSDRYKDATIINYMSSDMINIKGFGRYEMGFQAFQNGWSYDGKTDKATLSVEVNAKNICVLYKKLVSDKAGKFTVSVNGEEKAHLDTYFKDGWGDYSEAEIVVNGDVKKKYNIEINVDDDSVGKDIIILGLMIS